MVLGIVTLLAIYLATFVLYLIVPGRWVPGYVRERYHLNGLPVFIVSLALYAGLAYAKLIPWDLFYQQRWTMLGTAFVVGLIFTFAIVLPAPKTGRSFAADLYLGRYENPQWGRVDAKMFLYLIGAVMLALNLVSFAAHHVLTFANDPSPGVYLYTALFLFFLTEYLFFERVHLYTYDFVAERVGFKLGWGCLVFYPFFYCVGIWAVADKPNPHTPTYVLALAPILFFMGWGFSRGANLQKYYFKTQPQRTHFGPIEQRALTHADKRVLISGFWGLSRHVNYLGEILMAFGLALCLQHPAAFLYPLYYLALLVPRQLDDDKRCAEKYGPMWEDYKRAVPYKIIPGVY
jgi:protein-S-isoprenylcysteine O-methyltransferase Ste14